MTQRRRPNRSVLAWYLTRSMSRNRPVRIYVKGNFEEYVGVPSALSQNLPRRRAIERLPVTERYGKSWLDVTIGDVTLPLEKIDRIAWVAAPVE
jgi:hypothetical protein